jgi:hypothetical protein
MPIDDMGNAWDHLIAWLLRYRISTAKGTISLTGLSMCNDPKDEKDRF